MRNGVQRTRLRAGVVAGTFAALVAGSVATAPVAVAAPDDETIWEEGTVTSIADGDTLVATLDAGSGARGSNRIRTIGVQAPEVAHSGTAAECGASQATSRLKAQLPVGSRLQTRSVDVSSYDDYSGGRIVRSLYAQDEEGNWYDTSRGTVSEGWLMWFPLAADSAKKAEWAHNLEYRVLADDAASQARGLWSADLCGGAPYPGAQLRVWAKYWGTEEVYVQNLSGFDVDLAGWTIRDSAISGYQKLPDPDGPGTSTYIPAGKTVKVFSGDMNLNNLPADNAAFEGDAVYLMDNAGSLSTGNLRSWFAYPCNPDACDDVLSGQLSMSTPIPGSTSTHAPTNPGSVTAEAKTDGTGSVVVSWAPTNDAGGPNLSYTVTPSSNDGGAPLTAATGVTATTYTFSGLAVGKSYRFTVQAVSDGGASSGVTTNTAVTPAGPPAAPSNLVTEGRNGAVAVSWSLPSTGGVDADAVKYTVSVAGQPSTCTSTGATSCVVRSLPSGTYTFTVKADNGFASATSEVAGSPAPESTTTAPPAPSTVTAVPGKSSIVVSWPRSTGGAGQQVLSYRASVVGGSQSCDATEGATSCVITGLSNGQAATVTVSATNTGGTSPASPASNSATPFTAERASSATSAPGPVGNPWVPGYVDVTNTSGATARLGGYGLWDAKSSRYVNGSSVENRAAYLFDPNLTLGAGKVLRIYFGSVASAAAAPGGDVQVFASGLSLGVANDFLELANLNGAQIACMSTSGASCAKAKVTSVPSSPVGVTARSTTGDVTVTWGAPISRGGLAISSYTATAYDASVGGNAIASCTAGGDGRSCAFPAALGRTYFVDVVATNAQGASGPSWRVKAVPKTVPSAPANVSASGTPGGLNVSWSPAVDNGAAITKYTASAYSAATGGKAVGTCSTGNGAMTSCTIFGLAGGSYYVDVTATNRAGTGAPSSPRVAGAADAGNAVSTYSKGKVTVRWNAPANAAAAGITGYSAALYTKSSGGTKVGSCSAGATATSCKTKKMKKRSKYYIALTVNTTAGAYTVKPRIVTGPAKKASAPKVTSAAPSGKRVVISWSAPSFNGYSYLKSYGGRLYSKAKGGKVKASCSAPASTQTCTTKAVKKGTYYAAARVKNSKGWSSWSKRVKVKVP